MSPGEEIQRGIYATLKGNAAVMSLVDGIYDSVPDNPFGAKLAYISFGASDVTFDDADCIDGQDHSIQLDVWGRQVGSVQVKNICAAVKTALHGKDIGLTHNALVSVEVDTVHIFRDPDGLTTHGALRFSVQVEGADE